MVVGTEGVGPTGGTLLQPATPAPPVNQRTECGYCVCACVCFMKEGDR